MPPNLKEFKPYKNGKQKNRLKWRALYGLTKTQSTKLIPIQTLAINHVYYIIPILDRFMD
jgi:hypothetical protein